jgi:luciferase family oxidoreductase group 1
METINQPLITLGALDFCEIRHGSNPRNTLIDSLKLAVAVEGLGYSRYWIGEHHNTNFAQVSPSTMLMAIAGKTKRIRIGTGALLLSYHNALRVANDFRLLELLFPKRIDLGVGRGMLAQHYAEVFLGPDIMKARDLNYYEDQVKNLLLYLKGKSNVRAIPKNVSMPEFWMLGKNKGSMSLAARYGTKFCFSLFLDSTEQDAAAAFAEYVDSFQPSAELTSPEYSIAISGHCTENHEHIEQLTRFYNSEEAAIGVTIIGTPDECLDKLQEIQHKCKVNEIIFLDLGIDLEDRIRSYQILAEMCQLSSSPLSNVR